MTKALEILAEVTGDSSELLCYHQKSDMINPNEALEFAKRYALACLEKASNNADLESVFSEDGVSWELIVDKSTINTPDNLI